MFVNALAPLALFLPCRAPSRRRKMPGFCPWYLVLSVWSNQFSLDASTIIISSADFLTMPWDRCQAGLASVLGSVVLKYRNGVTRVPALAMPSPGSAAIAPVVDRFRQFSMYQEIMPKPSACAPGLPSLVMR